MRDGVNLGKLCSFSHSEEDIKIELIHNYVYDIDFYLFKYKTVNCPFNLLFHDKALCVYSHNWQDFRRNPDIYYYEAVACPHWDITKMIYEYSQGCPQGLQCTNCHGWKELEFHPNYYKTKNCPNGQGCPGDLSCPYYHSRQDYRNIKELWNDMGDQVWVYTSKNRKVKDTFKERKNVDDYIHSMEHSLNTSNEIVNNRDTKEVKQRTRSQKKENRRNSDTLHKSDLDTRNGQKSNKVYHQQVESANQQGGYTSCVRTPLPPPSNHGRQQEPSRGGKETGDGEYKKHGQAQQTDSEFFKRVSLFVPTPEEIRSLNKTRKGNAQPQHPSK